MVEQMYRFGQERQRCFVSPAIGPIVGDLQVVPATVVIAGSSGFVIDMKGHSGISCVWTAALTGGIGCSPAVSRMNQTVGICMRSVRQRMPRCRVGLDAAPVIGRVVSNRIIPSSQYDLHSHRGTLHACDIALPVVVPGRAFALNSSLIYKVFLNAFAP